MGFSLRCPACRGKFSWDVSKSFPDDCPLCDEHIGHDRADDDIVMPSIRAMTTAATDKVYRDIEKASEVRAEKAAEVAGVPVAEMSGLKITDLRPTTRPGDIAAPVVVNEVSRHMDAMNARGGQFGFGGSGLGFSGSVPTGPHPNAGARAQAVLRQSHPEMIARHAVGKSETGAAVIPTTDVLSERPANEMNQPGYRPRV